MTRVRRTFWQDVLRGFVRGLIWRTARRRRY